jgi:hypothetical protein
MNGPGIIRTPLPVSEVEAFRAEADRRMSAAKSDTALSDVIRDLEARLAAEGAPALVIEAFETLKAEHVRRMFAGARAG